VGAEPLFGVAVAAAVLGELLTMRQALGGVLVLMAGIAVQRPAPGRAAVAASD
jgi:drug/metabolite transporter (DMT)-like permease